MTEAILAIDPGSQKCGLALVSRDEEDRIRLIWRAIVEPEKIPEKIDEAAQIMPIKIIAVGSGTMSQKIVRLIRTSHPSAGVLVVDEENSTIQARERYWEHHPRRGWRRLLPSSLQVPPEPIDDFAALVLAERVLIP